MSIRKDDRVLDAARECVLAFGVRRTTMSEVARRSGLSRPTVYRSWPDVTSLVADLMTREMASIAAASEPAAGAPGSARESMVEHVVAIVDALHDNPLFVKILDVDPELVTTYVLDRLGASQHAALDFLDGGLRAGQADGSIRAGAPAELAAMVLLVVQSVALSGRLVAGQLPHPHLDAELRRLLHGYLAPGEHR